MMIVLEEVVMEIIVNVGQLCSLCFEVLYVVWQGNIDEVKSLLCEVDGYVCQVYKMQIKFIEQDVGEVCQLMMLIMVYV